MINIITGIQSSTCGEIEEMAHIIKCDLVNEGENQYENENYENILHFLQLLLFSSF